VSVVEQKRHLEQDEEHNGGDGRAIRKYVQSDDKGESGKSRFDNERWSPSNELNPEERPKQCNNYRKSVGEDE
jgi:hypothetical protein